MKPLAFDKIVVTVDLHAYINDLLVQKIRESPAFKQYLADEEARFLYGSRAFPQDESRHQHSRRAKRRNRNIRGGRS